MDWTPLIAPAVVAAVISGVVSVTALFMNRSMTLAMHEQRLVFEREQTERRTSADIALEEKKLALDRTLADWKRRTELAEQVLADFYKARELFTTARSPFAFGGEGATRPRQEGETESEARSRDAIYAPFERLSKEMTFFSEMHARRFRFMTLFGNDAAQPFFAFVRSYNEIGHATRMLINPRYPPRDQEREKYEKLIGWAAEGEDPVRPQLDEAVAAMERLCRPVLDANPP